MSTATMPDVFYFALAESPGDFTTLQALADWYEENGEADKSDCLRWTMQRRLFPFRYDRDAGVLVSSTSWNEGWYWWAGNDHYGRDWGHPTSCRLPNGVWKWLRHSFGYNPAVFKEYPTLRNAYEALFEAWAIVGPLQAVSVEGEWS